MKVVLAILLLVAAASAAPHLGALPYSGLTYGALPYSGFNAGAFPYSAGVLPYTAGALSYAHHAIAPVNTKVVNVDGGWPYTNAEGFSTGLANAGARVPLTYAAAAPFGYAGAIPYRG